MSNITLTLGSVTFQDFEVPAAICVAGKERLAVHRLMGGAQVIDVLGRDKQIIDWQGTLSGSDAAGRACDLDRLRLAGASLVLSWDIYSFAVVIESFSADYRSPWWIPYGLSCAVIQDLSSPVPNFSVATLDLITSDLTTAGQYVSVGTFQTAITAGDLVPGSAAYAGALATGISTQALLNSQLTAAATSLASSDIATASLSASFNSALTACGTLASVSAGLGYVNRAVANLQNLEP